MDAVTEKVKEKVIPLVRQGKDNDEIRRKLAYRVSNNAIGGIRAHMGKYDSYDHVATKLSDKVKENMRHMAVVEKKSSDEIYRHYRGRYRRIQIAGIFASLKRKGEL